MGASRWGATCQPCQRSPGRAGRRADRADSKLASAHQPRRPLPESGGWRAARSRQSTSISAAAYRTCSSRRGRVDQSESPAPLSMGVSSRCRQRASRGVGYASPSRPPPTWVRRRRVAGRHPHRATGAGPTRRHAPTMAGCGAAPRGGRCPRRSDRPARPDTRRARPARGRAWGGSAARRGTRCPPRPGPHRPGARPRRRGPTRPRPGRGAPDRPVRAPAGACRPPTTRTSRASGRRDLR